MKLPIYMVALISFGMGFASNGAGFSNLDFEDGDLNKTTPILPGDGLPRWGRKSDLLPGWQIQIGEGEPFEPQGMVVNYDFSWLGAFGLYDADFWRKLPVEGKAGFLASPAIEAGGVSRVSLVQQGLVPDDAKSIRYSVLSAAFEVSVNGLNLDLYDQVGRDWIGLREIAVDIAPWAGQEILLRFSQPRAEDGSDWSALDSIRFSPEPVIPEPSNNVLIVTGAVAIGLMRAGSRHAREHVAGGSA